ncbi:MAG TPA: RelA/SpoT domain-containing protein [Solirubrobacterales bacterium]|nr:RelA/SpoT domain-containing protein [Solirubrobacterales bacterium]
MASYSKTKVDRAGRFFADQIPLIAENPDYLDDPTSLARVQEAIAVIGWWRTEHAKPLSRVAANLRYYVRETGEPVVAQRLKRIPTIAGKLLREPGMKLSRMADIGGVRAILPDQAAAYWVASRLRRNWTITRVRDYVAKPKEDGYRAVHLISRNRGRLIEIQLRTPNQDFWANQVETLSRTAFPGLKFGQGPAELREFLFDYAEITAQEDLGLVSSEETLERVKERAIRMVNLLGDNNES